jgi:phospholipid transport system substrate-binding protein
MALLATVLLAAPQAVHAQPGPSPEADTIRTMLEERDAQIKAILNGTESDFTRTQRQELMTLINGFIDFRAMGQQALGPFWGDLSDEQRTEFVDVFQDVVRQQSMGDLEVYNSRVTYGRIEVEDDSAFVRTTTRYQGSDTPVDYVMHRQDGTWLATDIIVDEMSTAEGYARSFQNVIPRRGFDTLMNSLERRRARGQQETSAQ